MPRLKFEDITSRFPTTVLEEAKQRRTDKDLSLEGRFKLLGATTVLEGGPTRRTRTADIATACGVPESTLYRHFPKPVVETLAARGLQTLREDFYAPRYGALLDVATKLAINEEVDFPDAVSSWSAVYGAVANPASIYETYLSLPRDAGSLIAEHAGMITRNVKLLGVRSGKRIDDSLGICITPAVAAYDMTVGMTDLGSFTERTILNAVDPTR